MKNKLYKTLLIGLVATFALGGVSCTRGGDPEAQRAFQRVDLEYWTVFNSPDDFTEVIADYEALHPNVNINIQKFRFEEYEQMLLNALAEDRGPDIFSVHNSWVPSYRSKLMPLPPTTTLAVQGVTGTVKKEVVTQFQTTRSLNEFELRQNFLEQVYEDVFIEEMAIVDGEEAFGEPRIYALPVAFDTMAMYFNRDLLDNSGIAQPARTWNEFQEHVGRLARFDSNRNILTAGAAMGTSENVPRAIDILSVLMLQNGAEMEAGGAVNFHRIPESLRGLRQEIPGVQATDFYTSFANPNRQSFTWDESQPDGFDAFLQGRVGYFFGYQYHQELIRGLAPALNFGVSSLPQISGNQTVNYANYWVEGVSRKTPNIDIAWDFVQFMTSTQEASKYLARSGQPTALRELVPLQQEDPNLFVFASQLLTAQSWYHGQDPGAMEAIMKDLIDSVLAGEDQTRDLLELAAQRVQQTY